jgi:hypothetical protein
MARFCYEVVGRRRGWAYRLGETYSRIFPTQYEATAAAKASAIRMHEEGDETLVRVRDSTLCWHTALRIHGSFAPTREEAMLDHKMTMGR